MKILRSNEHDERGAVLVIVALMLVAIMGFGALVIDGGNGRQAQSQAQTAADAAALAGAQVLSEAGSATSAETAATSFATQNGFSSPTVDSPPPVGSGAYAGNADCVYVATNQTQPNYFSKAAGGGSIIVGAKAVACYKSGSGTTYGIIALNATACQSFYNNATGKGGVTITGSGSIFVNSSCNSGNEAFDNSGKLSVPSGSVINVVGGETTGTTCTNCTITTGVTAPNPVDPLAATVTTPPLPSKTTSLPCPTTTPATFSPGYYNCELTVSGSTTFLPGNYDITGGVDFTGNGISVQFGSSTSATASYFTLGGVGYQDNTNSGATFTSFSTSGVLFYMIGTTVCPAFETVSNGDNYTLYPPVSGNPDAGISIWIDKSVTGCDSQSSPAVGYNGNGSGQGVAGTVYSPSGETKFTANGGNDNLGAIVSDMVFFDAATSLDLTVGQASTGSTSYVTLTQ